MCSDDVLQPEAKLTEAIANPEEVMIACSVDDEPGQLDSQPIITITKVRSNAAAGNNAPMLYHYVAGYYEDQLNQENISRTVIENKNLHTEIKAKFELEFLSTLDEDQKSKFLKYTPCFVMTETELPINNEHIKIATIKPTLTSVEGRSAYTYTHSKDRSLYIRIFEPASPSDVEISAGKGNRSHSRLATMRPAWQDRLNAQSNEARSLKIKVSGHFIIQE